MCEVGPPTSRPLFAPLVLNGLPILLYEVIMNRSQLPPIKVYVSEEENAQITAQATAAGLSVSAYLRAVGLGTPLASKLDQTGVRELARISSDLNRLGGLLKAMLTNEERFQGNYGYGMTLQRKTMSLLEDISVTSDILKRGAKKVLRVEDDRS